MEGQVQLENNAQHTCHYSFIVFNKTELNLWILRLTSLDSHIFKNFSDPVHTFLSSEMVTAPVKHKYDNYLKKDCKDFVMTAL